MKVSLHTAQALIRPALPLRLTRGSADKKTYPPTHLAILGLQPKCAAAPVGNSSETHQPTGVGRHLLSQWVSVLQTLCHFRPDRRGLIQRVTTGLGFFGRPSAAPPDPPCGEVCPVRDRDRGRQLFHVLQCSGDDLGSLYTPAVRVFASGYVTAPEPDCLPFGPSLSVSLAC